MMSSVNIRHLKIAVTSFTFSNNPLLLKRVRKHPFAELVLNTTTYLPGQKELLTYLQGKDGAIIGREIVNDSVLGNCPGLKVLSKFGVGVDNIDFDACRRHGVEVVYSTGVNKRSVAEQTLAFMIFLERNLHRAHIQLKGGIWNKAGGRQLSGKTVGIIGVGNIGKEVVHLLHPFGCRILVNDIIDLSAYYRRMGLIEAGKEQIFREADIVTIHTPLTPKTRHMVNRTVLKEMKKEAFLINTARGPIVKQDDLKWALERGIIAGAALDVFEKEPPTDIDFLKLDNMICTPHIGGHSHEGLVAMGEHAVDNLLAFFKHRDKAGGR